MSWAYFLAAGVRGADIDDGAELASLQTDGPEPFLDRTRPRGGAG